MDKSVEILSDITVYMKYAKYLPEKQRRETWEELCERNMQMHIKKYPQLKKDIKTVYTDFVVNKKVLPSMRSMQFAGKPIDLNPTRIFNCSYLPIDDWRSFSEIMFLLLGGTGVGYSVQRSHVEQLPEIRKPSKNKSKRFVIGDSIEGWADAIKILMKSYFSGGSTIRFIYDDIRAKGAQLITSGGKAPGPQPLKDCIYNITKILENKQDGDKLSSLEVHDIVCHIADAVLAGGIRRAALICLFNVDDNDMISCKSNFKIDKYNYATIETGVNNQGEPFLAIAEHISLGKKYFDLNVDYTDYYGTHKNVMLYWVSEEDVNNCLLQHNSLPWYYFQPQRGRANNSAVLLRHKADEQTFLNLWERIEASNAGEPGIYFSNDKDWGTNPCCEIALRPYQFCNLTEINVSDIESQEDFNQRAEAAAFIGTLQAGYTDFHYLRPIWQKTTEKDSLLGVSMTGIASMKIFNYNIEEVVEKVKEVNKKYAEIIGIKPAARTTCVKPAGTTSLTLGTSSGIHAWHNDYYMRRIRVGKNEAIYTYLSIYHPELVEDELFRPNDMAVISIPQKAPEGSVTRHESALDMLKRVKEVSKRWIKPGHKSGQNTHNVSATVSLKAEEWKSVGEWMWKNRKYYNGLSVLPYDNGSYKQAPFEDITKEEYEEMYKKLSNIDLTKIVEITDNTTLSGELACAAGNCEVK